MTRSQTGPAGGEHGGERSRESAGLVRSQTGPAGGGHGGERSRESAGLVRSQTGPAGGGYGGSPPREKEKTAVIALGSNIGDRRDILQGGVDAIAGLAGVRVLAVSPVYETMPVGGPPQPDYLNAVVLARVALPARELLDRLHEIEAAFDRVRVVRWGPRTLDIDIITIDGEHSDDPELTLPHPRAHERAFVLAPWHDADPAAVLPGRGPVAALLAAVGQAGIRRCRTRLTRPEEDI